MTSIDDLVHDLILWSVGLGSAIIGGSLFGMAIKSFRNKFPASIVISFLIGISGSLFIFTAMTKIEGEGIYLGRTLAFASLCALAASFLVPNLSTSLSKVQNNSNHALTKTKRPLLIAVAVGVHLVSLCVSGMVSNFGIVRPIEFMIWFSIFATILVIVFGSFRNLKFQCLGPILCILYVAAAYLQLGRPWIMFYVVLVSYPLGALGLFLHLILRSSDQSG